MNPKLKICDVPSSELAIMKVPMADRQKISDIPSITKCWSHEKYVPECKKCREVRRASKNKKIQELIWQAGNLIFTNWEKYLTKNNKDVFETTKAITKDLFPWNPNKFGKTIWEKTLNTVKKQLSESFVPVCKDDQRNNYWN